MLYVNQLKINENYLLLLQCPFLIKNDRYINLDDLSHFHAYEQAQAIDNDTITRILAFKTDITPENACGCYALNGFLDYCKKELLKIKLVNHANSGDIFGDKKEVVGYASFIVY